MQRTNVVAALFVPSLARLREESGLSGSMENGFAIHIGLTSWLAQTHRRTMVAWSIHSFEAAVRAEVSKFCEVHVFSSTPAPKSPPENVDYHVLQIGSFRTACNSNPDTSSSAWP